MLLRMNKFNITYEWHLLKKIPNGKRGNAHSDEKENGQIEEIIQSAGLFD